MKAIEQLANLSVRNAVVTLRALASERRDSAKTAEEIRTWLRKIEGLTEVVGETRERLSLQGSCWKRLAQVEPAGAEADAALAKMAERYDRAAAIDETGDKSYPRFMACVARISAAVRTGNECDATAVQQLKALISAAPPENPDFWQLIQWADARLADVILEAQNPLDEQQSLLSAYERAWRHVGSPVKLKSVIEQLEFYEDIFSSGAPATELRRTSARALAAKVRGALEADFLGRPAATEPETLRK